MTSNARFGHLYPETDYSTRPLQGEVIHRGEPVQIPTRHGTFTALVYTIGKTGIDHLAMIMGDVSGKSSVLTRLHSECLTGDVFGSYRCDCGEQLDLALRRISEEGQGILLYLRGHEGRGIGLANKIRAYALQEKGFDTVDANRHLGLPDDLREYRSAASILSDLRVPSIRLISNNPKKFKALGQLGISVDGRVRLTIPMREENERYIRTKQKRLGHYLEQGE
ncbi:GTP cyclohydrolase II [Methylonatrum kenyense]|uniref:GTP cyclohydrolase II n=1 Tax=Methylonatrum kenyense TaxID=455253 RepID=UPI0020BFA22A|nr:GTP cyclohydrolase II [Methylonatrum kenyense]MCK8517317.1 GTP cyclohydrolase II [Methylonatrum kenyense]